MHSNRRRRRVLLLSALAWLPAGAWAAEPADVFDLPLEALSELTVVTTSRRAEPLGQAPGAIAVVDAEQIRRYGARDLADVIDLATGTLVLGTYMFPVNAIALRGDLPGQYNTHVLLLINGRPAWEGQNSGTEMALLRAFPIAAIARVEVLRGPGSVLYGTSAFAGVINVITAERLPGAASLTLADERGRGADLSLSGPLGEFSASLALHAYRDAGFDFEARDETGFAFHRDYDEDNRGLFGRLQSQHWDFQLSASSSRMGNTGTLPLGRPFAETVDMDTDRHLLDLGYRHDLGGGEFSAHLTHNRLRTDYTNPGPQPSFMDGRDTLLELGWARPLGDTLDLLAGGQWQRLAGESAGTLLNTGQHVQIVPDYREIWRRAFLELRWQATEDWQIHAGLQVDQPAGQDRNLSKRLAFDYRFSPAWSAGLHYAEAYRSASLLEKTISLPRVVVGNPELEPERNRSSEAVLHYQEGPWRAALSLFRTQTEDLIDRVPDPVLGATYINQSAIRYQGGELELAYTAADYALDLSWSRQDNRRGALDDVTGMPRDLFKLGLRSRGAGAWQAGLHILHARGWTPLPSALARNPDSADFSYLRANLSYALGPAWSLELSGENLLDEDIFVPEFARARMNTLPYPEQGRSLWLSLGYRFGQ